MFEKQEREVCDEVYNLIAELMTKKKSSEDEFIYKSYILVRTMLNPQPSQRIFPKNILVFPMEKIGKLTGINKSLSLSLLEQHKFHW